MRRINKKIILGVLLIALLTAPIVALIAGCDSGDTWPPPAISKDQAIAILVSEIIEPAAEYKNISAFMLSEPLQNGGVVTSESGEDYPIDTSTWFVFIDDEPMAFFVHDCRYVFIDGETGSYDVVDETWPPEINNLSMWDTQNVGRGHIIELYSVLDSAVPITGSPSQAPTGDYGDAPDGQDAYWGIPGSYPALFNTTNSLFGRPGGHTLNIGEETLGVNVSAEVDANDPADPDGVPNLVDADSDERIFVIVEGTQAKLAFTVTVAPNAPDVTRYANALIDFDQSGNWSAGTYGTEWVVVNLAVDVDPGSSETVITPWFSWGNKSVLPSPVWMRLLLAREEVDEALFANVGGWDGSGQFEYGEVEDYFVFLTDNPPLPEVDYWPPPPPNGNGNGNGNGDGDGEPLPPGPQVGPCGYDIDYYYLLINCGDIGKSTLAKTECGNLEQLFKGQNYTSGDYLKPSDGTNTPANIEAKLKAIKDKVKCGDRVLIAIVGHGNGSTISLYNSAGQKAGQITPSQINTWLDIPECDGKECDVEKECCFVDIVIISCHAQAFFDGLKREGRTVAAASTKVCAWGGDGGYATGFIKDMKSTASDTDPKDGYVTVKEAHKTAAAHQKKHHKTADAAISAQQCDCTCPSCVPGIDVEKWIWYELYGTWVDEIEVLPGALVAFVLEIESDGTCRDIVDLEIIDFLPYCLVFDYEFTPILYYNDMAYDIPPCDILQVEGGVELYWNLAERVGPLAPGESIAIEYYAYAEYPGENINILYGTARCAYDPTNIVDDTDSATVWVQTIEDLLGGYLEVSNVESFWSDPYTCESFFDVYFEVQDLTGGTYPVTYVGLYINGLLYDFWDTADIIVERYVPDIPADCGETIDVELVAMNLESVEPIPITVGLASFTTPSPPPPVAEDVLSVGFEAYAECTFLEDACLGCTVTIFFWAEDISSGDIYPVTDVVLRLDGVPWFESGTISESYFEHEYELEAWCGETIEIEVIAMNLIGLEAIAADSITTPSHP